MAMTFAERRKQRQKTKRLRAKERTKRRKTFADNITRRAQIRADVRKERVKQKGASGFFTPEGVRARQDIARDVIGTAAAVIPGGKIGQFADMLPQRRDTIVDVMEVNGVPAQNPSFGPGGGGGGGGFLAVEEEKPFYTNPIFIGGAVIGGIIIFNQIRKK
tara:strand:+ start:7314 stop:7796 length:483 start_codon:yes stop_codon:yes gene_type:complete